MILSTTPQIESHPIREYKGVVTGEVIIGANVLKDFMAGLTDFFGGRSGSYEKVRVRWETPGQQLQGAQITQGQGPAHLGSSSSRAPTLF